MMKRQLLLTSLLALCCVFTTTIANTHTTQKTDDLSYTLGYTTGQKISQGLSQSAKIEKTDFASGISDAIQGKASHISPEKMREVLAKFQSNMMLKQQIAAQKAIEANRHRLVKSSMSPVDGNPKGKVTLVEFFDYQCIHCRRLTPNLAELKKNDPELRIVYKELPIFGENSQFASKAALAAKKQGKYQALHNKLMTSKKPLTQEHILALAKEVNIDITKLKKEMESKDIRDELAHNERLAKAIGIEGTPSLVITTTKPVKGRKTNPNSMDDLVSVFIPGALPIQMLQETIAKVQAKATHKPTKLPKVENKKEEAGTWPGI